MPAAPPVNATQHNNYRIPLFLALIAAGLAGNHFNFPLFLNINFLFGSIFAMLALQFCGPGRGMLAAAAIAGYTYILWNHPYAIMILTAEVAIVGWLMGRRKIGMVLADTLYWLCIGMPAVYLFYHLVMHVPLSTTYITMTKQMLNGITNALVARLIFFGHALWTKSTLTSYREIVYNLLAFFVLCPTLILLAISGRTDFNKTDHAIREALIDDSQRVNLRLETWVLNRKSAILSLAEMAATRSPQQLQPYLELAKKSDLNFERIGLLDRDAITTAYFPLIDELGHKNIGKSFADRPYVPQLKLTLKPMLSNVNMGRLGLPKPFVAMLAPVVIHGEYRGYAIGILSLDQVREHLVKSTEKNTTLYTLLDKNGNVIMSNRTELKIMAPFKRGAGTLEPLDTHISQWVPTLPPNTPASERWKNSFYVVESTIGNMAEWKLILEQPVAPFQKALYDQYTSTLTLLFLILLGTLALAEVISRKIVVTLGQLRTLTYELPIKLAAEGTDIVWPESGITEATHLINNFREMADSLSEQFIETRQINESLEQRVEERTKQLLNITHELSFILENAPVGIAKIIDRKQVYVNRKTEEIFQYSKEEMESRTTRKLYPSDEAFENFGYEAYPALAQGLTFDAVQELIRKDGAHILVRYIGKAIEPTDLSKGILWLLEDITERKQAETELCLAKAAAEAANIAKSQFLANMSHEIRTPMNGLTGLVELLLSTELTKEQRTYAELAKQSGNHLVQLISDVLDLSKIEAHKMVLDIRPFDLQAETTGTINLLSLHAQEKGLKLDFLIVPDVPLQLKGDAGRLRQIITNLVGNAIKFTATGSVSLHIHKETENEQQATLRFLVRDSGIGIAADKLKIIFEAFTQADGSTTREFGGTGLGLTISRQLAELMGGSVGVESVEGEGTTFWFTALFEKQIAAPAVVTPFHGIPPESNREDGAISPCDPPQRHIPRNPPELTGQVTRLLLAEDDITNQLVTKSILEKIGYQVEVANNGDEALNMLKNSDYNLVLMDCMMPVMNGYDATAVIRNPNSAVRNHDIPVIALTAKAMREDRDTCLAAGMDDYLAKPLNIADLLTMLATWVPLNVPPTVLQTITQISTNKSQSDDIFDVAGFTRRNLGDLELSCEVATIFIDGRLEYVETIRTSLAAHDAGTLRTAAHKLNGAAANLGLPRLSETAQSIESFAKSADFENIARLFPELEIRFKQAVDAIQQLLIIPQKRVSQ